MDRTPPVVTIQPPTADLRVGPGLPLQIIVDVTDEIGVSQVTLEAAGELTSIEQTIVASGAGTASVLFSLEVPFGALSGPTITLYALAADLSGNLAAATEVILEVDPSVTIAVTTGFAATELVTGSNNLLDNPTAIAVSAKNGFLYVTDNSGGVTCAGACIRRIDPANGNVDAAAVETGMGTLEGVAFDAAGDFL